MEILGVGPTELIFIIIIALIVLGPKDLAKTGSTVGKWLNNLIQSDSWKLMQKTTRELRRLPTELMREDNLKKILTPDDLLQQAADRKRDVSFPPRAIPSNSPRPDPMPVPANENTIHPPRTEDAPPAKPAQKKPAAAPRKKTTAAKKKVFKPVTKPAPRKKSNA